ncbi:hypothetical protein B566_EDAN007769 [Ephemera danica]|nr:hypothetical protein B566_EDAN007769 [Ephemera danica]
MAAREAKRHWCALPELEAALNISTETPGYVGEEGGYPAWAVPLDVLDGGLQRPSQCRQYAVNFTELDWVCDESWRPNLAQSVFFLGAVLGSVLLGWLGDQKGRLPVLVRLTYNNSYMMMYIIMLEYVSPGKRSVVANLPIALFLTFGLVTLPWLAYLLWDWRIFSIISSLPMAIGLLAPWLIPESGRWLLAKGRVSEAETILRKCAAVNKRPVDEQVFAEFRAYSKQFAESQRTNEHTFLELFAAPVLRKRIILLTALWMLMSLSYDGHVRNLGNLEQYSLYVTFSLTGLLELPADVLTIVTLDSLGRRWTNFGALFFSAFFSVLAAAVQKTALESENFGLDQPCLLVPCWEARKRRHSHAKASIASPDPALGSPVSGITNKSFSGDEDDCDIEVTLRPEVTTPTPPPPPQAQKKGTIVQSVTSL